MSDSLSGKKVQNWAGWKKISSEEKKSLPAQGESAGPGIKKNQAPSGGTPPPRDGKKASSKETTFPSPPENKKISQVDLRQKARKLIEESQEGQQPRVKTRIIPPPPERKPRVREENPFAEEKLESIDTKKIDRKRQEAFARELSRIDEVRVPRICEYSGDALERDYFIVYAPNRKHISRRVRQSKERCLNCGDVLKPKSFHRESDLTYCECCLNRGHCHSCGEKKKDPDLSRLEGVRGIYCETCRKGGLACAACRAPLSHRHPGLNLCSFCQQSSVQSLERAREILHEVQAFFFELDLDFSMEDLSIKVLKSKKPLSLEEGLLIREGGVAFDRGFPEPRLYDRLSLYFADSLVRDWKVVRSKPAMGPPLIVFLQMIFYENGRYFQLALEKKKQGFELGKDFQPLYQAFFKQGPKKSYQLIRAKLA